jgi:hypothetical protein
VYFHFVVARLRGLQKSAVPNGSKGKASFTIPKLHYVKIIAQLNI